MPADPAPPRPPARRPQGVYLRLDITRVVARILAEGQIPLANVSSTYALYTDADVMFTGQGSHADISTCTQPLPRLIRLGPQHARGTSENSGVLLLNISSWGAELPPFVEYGRLRDFRFGQYDQGARAGGRAGRLAGVGLQRVWRRPCAGARKERGEVQLCMQAGRQADGHVVGGYSHVCPPAGLYALQAGS